MEPKCPYCEKVLTEEVGRLEQTGLSYLETVVWACNDQCGYRRWEPPPQGTPWKYDLPKK